ncbi:penicillin-binding protein [Pochonia chlamydosporia 170]|uniref:Penicillin-binding protein n=1 Tax=Pochonia chlamydosporia 170 TaxID=1380566 RepID=A0A179FWM2_METCM|nr:penicillin-binding protein [Pochonia chlamydosporia 170]OAQ70024.1 penicillin-binding protein [Pochonia chlamydosporia 170]
MNHNAQDTQPEPNDIASRLQKANTQVSQICQASGVPGASIAIIHKGKLLHTYNHGYSDLENQIKTDSNTAYGIGSLTKAFIAAAIAKLVHAGHLTWHTPIKDLLPELNQDDSIITNLLTVTDILSHRCGLAGGAAMSFVFQGDGDMLLPKESLFTLFNHFPQLFPFRGGWSYFVWGYALAGLVIDRVTGKGLAQALRELVLSPLGMTSTGFDVDSLEGVAEPYAGLADGTAFHLSKRQVFRDTFFEASGGLFSSVKDLTTWAGAILDCISRPDESVLKDVPYILSNHAAIMNPSLNERSYGLGWIRTQLPGRVGLIGDNMDVWTLSEQPLLGDEHHPMQMIYHQGSTVGYYSHMALFPATESAVIVLTNSIALSDAADWISRTFTQALFDIDSNDYVKLAMEASKRYISLFENMATEIENMRDGKTPRLDTFAGRYVHSSQLFVVDLAVCDSRNKLALRFQGRDSQEYELRYLCEGVFEWVLGHDESKRRGRYNSVEMGCYLFRFRVDGGRVVSFTWAADGLRSDVFLKVGGLEDAAVAVR